MSEEELGKIQQAYEEGVAYAPTLDEVVQVVKRHQMVLEGLAVYVNELRAHIESLYALFESLEKESPPDGGEQS